MSNKYLITENDDGKYVVVPLAKSKVKKLHPDATIPTSEPGNAGYDLYSVEDGIIPSKSHKKISTGIALSCPLGHYGRIAPRSGLAYKFGIDVFAGVVDEIYRGEIGVILFNAGDQDFEYKKGDRIAQIIFTPYERVHFEQIEELDETDRGEKGFGSSGR
jgi:dUTP pyrophosphatase